MRTLLAVTAMLSTGMATAAEAGERVVTRGTGVTPPAARPDPTRPDDWTTAGRNAAGSVNGPNRPRWGGRIQGRWWAGYRAPGGWNAYHRPVRGWVLPSYWFTPNWYIKDWAGYGLPRPPAGYNWSRYYDDAVLLDSRGKVYDSIGGVDWDQFDVEGADYTYHGDAQRYDGYAYQGWDYAAPVAPAPGAPYAAPPRSDGTKGAVAGAALGGVAGAGIAGRGARLGGALIGGGVGALTGYAVDRSVSRSRVPPPPPPHGAGYAYPPAVATRMPSPPPPPAPPPAPVVHTGPGTTVVTTSSGSSSYSTGGYYANGYYYPGTSVTTVTVQSQPVVTTTTTETWE